MDIHVVPPHNHQVNAAERAIAIFKEHFIVGLATVDRNCPLQLWDEFLHQVEPTLSFSISHAVIPANLPTKRSTALMTSTKLHSCQLVQKALSTTTLLSVPAGRRME
jgi:hypothetical protein